MHGLDGFCQGVGGTEDHVHLLLGLRSTHRLSDFMRELKKSASTWIHQTIGEPSFAWQKGYGAFTVSPTAVPAVRRYIANQEEHHREQSYRDEFVGLLQQAGVEFDPKYLD